MISYAHLYKQVSILIIKLFIEDLASLVNLEVNFYDPTRKDPKKKQENSEKNGERECLNSEMLVNFIITNIEIISSLTYEILMHAAERNLCSSFLQLLLPELPKNVKEWRKRLVDYHILKHY